MVEDGLELDTPVASDAPEPSLQLSVFISSGTKGINGCFELMCRFGWLLEGHRAATTSITLASCDHFFFF